MPPPSVTPDQVARLRLQSLGLVAGVGPELQTPADVVRHHLAMQSQDWGASRWAIGSRLPGAVEADVLGAYDRGEIVRSWPMRGTVHAVPAEDLHWLLELCGVRALAGVQRRWENLGIEEPMLERAREVAVELLRGGGRCTRAELQAALTEAGLDLGGQRSYHTVWFLAQTGTLVQGPTANGEQLVVLLDEWITVPRRLLREAALAELGRRYFQARGPASIEDLSHWSKLGKRDCRLAIDANRDELVELRRGDETLFMPLVWHEQFDPDAAQASRTSLALAGFDEHLLGFRNRDDVLDPGHATLVDPGRNGVFRWTIVDSARVVGTWSRARRTRRVVVELRPFAPLSSTARARVEKAVARWAAFAGVAVELTRGAGERIRTSEG